MTTQIIGLTTPLMGLVFAAIFLLLWKQGGMGRHVLSLAAAYVMMALGFAATHFLDDAAPYLFHTTQVFYTAGTIFLIAGATGRIGRKPPLAHIGLVYAITAVTLAVAVFASEEAGPRLYIVNTGYGIMFLLGTMVLINSRRRELFDRLVILVFVLSTVNFFVRPVLALTLESSIPIAEYRSSVYYSVLNVAMAVMSLIVAITLIGACTADLIRAMRDRSERDDLTGLRNRRAFEHEVEQMLERAKNSDVDVGLVVADIDHFKQVNDLWGHQAGDAAIASFGRLIERNVRGCDITGRIGGEEFCIVVWDCDLAETARLAERIRIAFATQPQPCINEDIRLTSSFGVAGWYDAESYLKLFARADRALYCAKEEGRNRIVCERAKGQSDRPHGFESPRNEAQVARLKVG